MPNWRWTLLPLILVPVYVLWTLTRERPRRSCQCYCYLSDPCSPLPPPPPPPPPSSPAVNELPTCFEEPIYADNVYAGSLLSRPHYPLSGRMKPARRRRSSDTSGYRADASQSGASDTSYQQELELSDDDAATLLAARLTTRAIEREQRLQLLQGRQLFFRRRSQHIRGLLASDLLKLQEIENLPSGAGRNHHARFFHTSALEPDPLLLDSLYGGELRKHGLSPARALAHRSDEDLLYYIDGLGESLLHEELLNIRCNEYRKALRAYSAVLTASALQYLNLFPEQTDFEVRHNHENGCPWAKNRHDHWLNLERSRRQRHNQPRSLPENWRRHRTGPLSPLPERLQKPWRRDEHQGQQKHGEFQATSHHDPGAQTSQTMPTSFHSQQESSGPRPNPPHHPQPAAPPPIPNQFAGQSSTATRPFNPERPFSPTDTWGPSSETYEAYTSFPLGSLIDRALERVGRKKQKQGRKRADKGRDTEGTGGIEGVGHTGVSEAKGTHGRNDGAGGTKDAGNTGGNEGEGGIGDTEGAGDSGHPGSNEGERDTEATRHLAAKGGKGDDKWNNEGKDSGYDNGPTRSSARGGQRRRDGEQNA